MARNIAGKSKNPKKLISNCGYAKFIQADGKVKLSVNEEKIAEEAAWDGFHGIATNDLESTAEELLMQYPRLWTIEECFRIQKDDLAMRPIFHWKPERIQAHILLCYMAFALIRHAEWRVQVIMLYVLYLAIINHYISWIKINTKFINSVSN